MADDRDLIIGQLQGGFQAIKDHLERQDEQHAEDKRQAIAARDEKHRENLARFDAMGQRIDKIDGRVSALEKKRETASAETRGGMKAWAVIGAGFTALGSLLAAYGKDILDALRSAIGHG